MSFHVPEGGRETVHPRLGTRPGSGNNGCFVLVSPAPGWRLWLIGSDGLGWEHVSVHAFRERGIASDAQTRTPTWAEMGYVKNVCWDDEDVVMQLHPKRSEYVNLHPHVLHLWRPIGVAIPTPPAVLVGPVGTGAAVGLAQMSAEAE